MKWQNYRNQEKIGGYHWVRDWDRGDRKVVDVTIKEQHKKSLWWWIRDSVHITILHRITHTYIHTYKYTHIPTEVKLEKSEKAPWIVSKPIFWLWYYVIILQNITNRGNCVKSTQNLPVLFLTLHLTIQFAQNKF